MIFRGTIRGGEFKPYNAPLYAQFLQRREGKRVSVEVKGITRSNAQNSYYHAVVVNIIADYTGYTHDEVHAFLKDNFLAPLVRRRDIIMGDKTGKSRLTTTTLSTDEFSQYVEDIRRWAAMELGLHIPDPGGM